VGLPVTREKIIIPNLQGFFAVQQVVQCFDNQKYGFMIVKMFCRSFVIHKVPVDPFADQNNYFVIDKKFCRSRMIDKRRIWRLPIKKQEL
tara:strand:- start:176 stop:445 length:270 start_codon:yes stop_codon:yes gene_type:complete